MNADTRHLLVNVCANILRSERGIQVLGLHCRQRHSTLYTGMTGDLYTRIMQHRAGEIEGFSKRHNCNRLVHYAGYNEVLVMINREKQIKSWRRKKKVDLIEKTNPRWEDLAQNWGRSMKLKGESIEEIP
jgi:putative endonuclease